MGITQITDKKDFIRHYDWIKECGFTDISPENVLANCLLGKYWGFVGELDGKDVGIAIGYTKGTMAYIVGLWCKNNLSKFLDSFIQLLKDNGYKTIRASSDHPEKAYARLMGMEKLWSIYEREL